MKDHQEELVETSPPPADTETAEIVAKVQAILKDNPPVVSTGSQVSLTQAEVTALLNQTAATKPPGS